MIKRTLGSLLVLALLLTASPISFAAPDLNEQDKQKHIQASAGISLVTYSSFRANRYSRLTSTFASLTLTLFIGHMKEQADKTYDHQDMQANAVGATAGILLPLSFTF